jgi:hypothetical protein
MAALSTCQRQHTWWIITELATLKIIFIYANYLSCLMTGARIFYLKKVKYFTKQLQLSKFIFHRLIA